MTEDRRSAGQGTSGSVTVADRITAVLAEHRLTFLDQWICGRCRETFASLKGADAHVTAAVLADLAADHAIIALPEQLVDRSNVAEPLRSLPMWATGRSWTCLRDSETVEYEAEDQNIYGTVTPTEARSFAAALLAAARAAEKEKGMSDNTIRDKVAIEPEPCKHCDDRIAITPNSRDYVHVEGWQQGKQTCAVTPYGFHAEPVGAPCGDHPANPCNGSRGIEVSKR